MNARSVTQRCATAHSTSSEGRKVMNAHQRKKQKKRNNVYITKLFRVLDEVATAIETGEESPS